MTIERQSLILLQITKTIIDDFMVMRCYLSYIYLSKNKTNEYFSK